MIDSNFHSPGFWEPSQYRALQESESYLFADVDCTRDQRAKRIWIDPAASDHERRVLDRPPRVIERGAQLISFVLGADRYGGPGVGVNGGSGRCVVEQGFQYKGIGRTPLVGTDAHKWHSNGACSLLSCIRELIWSQLTSRVLPRGAATVRALYDCDETCESPEAKILGTLDRGVVAREFILRPAHFMRAPMFGGIRSGGVVIGDLDRVRLLTTRALLDHLGKSPKKDLAKSGVSGATAIISTVIDAISEQIAAAYARRILHGNVSPSNIGWNGEYLDFDTCTTLSEFAPFTMGGFDTLPLGNEHDFIARIARELCYSFARFGLGDVKLTPILRRGVDGEKGRRYERHLNRELLELGGVPRSDLPHVPKALQQRFVELLKQQSRARSAPVYLVPGNCWPPPAHLGNDYPCALVSEAALRILNNTVDRRNDLAREFEILLRDMYKCAAQHCANPANAIESFAFNALRRVAYTKALDRAYLDAQITRAGKSEIEIGMLVEASISAGVAGLQSMESRQLTFSLDKNTVEISADRGVSVDGIPGSWQKAVSLLSECGVVMGGYESRK